MFSAIRKRLTYVNVAITVALVFAMSGGAYAAGKYLITSTKQISPKVLKSLQGKTGGAGSTGALGAAGPAGPAGPQGPAGPKGETGATGPAGSAGAAGQNGKDGTTGFTATLPSRKTEKGTWLAESSSGKGLRLAVSFPIPLASGSPIGQTRVMEVRLSEVKEGKIPAGCSGTPEEPEAEPGYLCVFEGGEGGGFAKFVAIIKPGDPQGASGFGPTGAIVLAEASEASSPYFGTWAVTAE